MTSSSPTTAQLWARYTDFYYEVPQTQTMPKIVDTTDTTKLLATYLQSF